MRTANDLRAAYVQYFVERGHRHVSSAPLVPPDDPTLLFTSAGMVQFKPLYSGKVDLPYRRAVSVQKCLRAGGKGSDLENVGKTLRHHTFFEMLGNFSFGDYFKREALEWGWDFVWNVMRLPRERLWATTFYQDDEAAEILERELGFPRSRIIPLDEKENFWGPAGDTGACGPCSEVIFFMGTDEELAEASNQSVETIARRIVAEGDLFFEIWNMVFPQFDQQPDGSRPPLKNRGIDTGAGLERMTTALQFIQSGGEIRSPYETDLLKPIVDAAACELGVAQQTLQAIKDKPTIRFFNEREAQDESNLPLFACNAVADHIRALTFAIGEGVMPSNDGRGYVIRRILRRALRFASLVSGDRRGAEARDLDPFLHKLVDPLVETMRGAYPEVAKLAGHVQRVIRLEEESFLGAMRAGERILREKIETAVASGKTTLAGDDVFDLHSTYGYPPEMTAEIIGDYNRRIESESARLSIDHEGYARAMEEHKTRARTAHKGGAMEDIDPQLKDILEQSGPTEFVGYDMLESDASVLAILVDGKRRDALQPGEKGLIILDATPFYAEAGGQIGDRGVVKVNGALFSVRDTTKTGAGIYLHHGKMKEGALRVGQAVSAEVESSLRYAAMRNHTATHLLQRALKLILGEHITQAGSLVDPHHLRFDFTHFQSVKPHELVRIEAIVNEQVRMNREVTTQVLPKDEAFALGAIAPFGEKYGEIVRVVQIDDYSTEFCGGTHLGATGEIGLFLIDSESSVASGVRRIEALTGEAAYAAARGARDTIDSLGRALGARADEVPARVDGLLEEIKSLRRELNRVKQETSAGGIDQVIADAPEIRGVKVVAHRAEGLDAAQLRTLADVVRAKAKSAVAFLASADGEKVTLICAVSDDIKDRAPAGAIVKEIAPIVGGKGGGRADLAQAGGKNPEKLNEALNQVTGVVEQMLMNVK